MTLTKPFADYPHTRRAGSIVYLAGQGCRDPESNECCGLQRDVDGKITGYDIEEQTDGVLRNIERALKAERLTSNDLIDVTVFLTDMVDFNGMNRVWNTYFEGKTAPTRTTVAVRQLPGDNFVEMKAIAFDGGYSQ